MKNVLYYFTSINKLSGTMKLLFPILINLEQDTEYHFKTKSLVLCRLKGKYIIVESKRCLMYGHWANTGDMFNVMKLCRSDLSMSVFIVWYLNVIIISLVPLTSELWGHLSSLTLVSCQLWVHLLCPDAFPNIIQKTSI